MVGGQRTTPGKCIRSNCLSRAKGDAGRGLAASIIDGIGKLNRSTRAIGRNVDGCCIRHYNRCATRLPLNRSRTDRHINLRDLKGRR